MKTIMIVDDDENFTKRIRKTCQDENITILTASNNRHALKHTTENNEIDLFLIPTHSKRMEKGFLPFKSTDSLSSSVSDQDQILFENSSPEDLKKSIL
ncbi:MAG: hypothetical protein KGY50_03745, partial [Candidatus Thermoplasmatota archaeon]|nr:hypothetical protein [Candidatus Thermoplasmatota archaeon]